MRRWLRFDLAAAAIYAALTIFEIAEGNGWHPAWVWATMACVWLVTARLSIRNERRVRELEIDRTIRRAARRRAER